MNEEDFIRGLDKRDHPLKMIYPICLKVYGLIDRIGATDIFGNTDTIERLSVNEDSGQIKLAYACKTLANVFLILALALLLTILLMIKETQNHVMYDGMLERAQTGYGVTDYNLTVTDSQTGEKANVTVHVSEQRCSDDELDRMFEEAFQTLTELVFQDGDNSDCVMGNLKLIDSIPGTSIVVSWPQMDFNYIFSDGTIRHEVIDEPVVTSLVVRLEYFDDIRLYSFPIKIMPTNVFKEQSFEEKLEVLLTGEDKSSGNSRWYTLPKQVDDEPVYWSEKRNENIRWVPIIGILAAFAVIPGAKEELKKKDRQRTTQMINDYPELISKFELLIGAGMTCRGSWEKICKDYTQSLQNTGTKRYAYEEMLRSQRELNLGMAEAHVYEEFGRRSGVQAYQRLGTLLANNLKRGSRDIINMLKRESQEAFAERKSDVQMRVEEAGTKLLFPMLGMLCLVIAIVVVPAFTAFTR